MRICGGPMNHPADVIPAGEQFFSHYSDHALAREATELYCQASAQLGRRSPRCR